MHRVLLLIAKTSYRADDFLDAAAELGVEVVVGSDHRSSLSERVPDASLYLDFDDLERSTARIVELAGRRPLSAIVAAEDDGVELAAAAADALDLPYNPVEAVRAARHKDLMRRALERADVPSPCFDVVSVDEDEERLALEASYPCVIKPVSLSASRGVIRADNPEEFAAAFRRISRLLRRPGVGGDGDDARRLLIEDYIPGIEVALEGLLVDGELEVLALLDKPDPLEGPYFEETLFVTPSRLPEAVQADIQAVAGRTARALGLRDGPIHAELRCNDRGVWPLEIAPRSIGGLCSRVLRFGAGLSLEEVILRHATGSHREAVEREPMPAGVMMIPIPRRGVLREVRGLERARSVRGIEDVTLTIPYGEAVVPLPEGNRYLGFIFARGGASEEVEVALREAHRRLDVVIEPV